MRAIHPRMITFCIFLVLLVSTTLQAQDITIKSSDGLKQDLQIEYDPITGNILVVWESNGRIFSNVLKPKKKNPLKYKSKKEREISEGEGNRRPVVALLPEDELFIVAWDTGPEDLTALALDAASTPAAGSDILMRTVKPKNAKGKGGLLTAASDGNMNVMPQLLSLGWDTPDGSPAPWALLFYIKRNADGSASGVGPARNDSKYTNKVGRFGIGAETPIGTVGGLSARFQVAKNFGIQGVLSFAHIGVTFSDDVVNEEKLSSNTVQTIAGALRGDIGIAFTHRSALSIIFGVDILTTPENFPSVDTYGAASASFGSEGPVAFFWREGKLLFETVLQFGFFAEVHDDEGDPVSPIIRMGQATAADFFGSLGLYTWFGAPGGPDPSAVESRIWTALARPGGNIEVIGMSEEGTLDTPVKIIGKRNAITDIRLIVLTDPLRAIVVWLEQDGDSSHIVRAAVKTL